MLSLFEGQMSLDEILKSDYWLIAELAKAKERYLIAKQKAQQQAMDMEAMKSKKVK
jgi:hypothetical protein